MTERFGHNEPVVVSIGDDVGAALVGTDTTIELHPADALDEIRRIEAAVGPRWVWWGRVTADALVSAGLHPARCWDLDAVHRLLHGGWRGGPAIVWAGAHGLDPDAVPRTRPLDLFSIETGASSDPDDAIGDDGYLAPRWVDGDWASSTAHLRRWSRLGREVFELQQTQLARLDERPAAGATARSESTTELLCAELGFAGLPIDVAQAEHIIGGFIGPRPAGAADEQRLAAERDERVLAHLGTTDHTIDLRNPANVKSLLRRAGIEVTDTRAWRLEQLRHQHPIVEALLVWRKAERICTTFGYRWLDEHVVDGRLRGTWAGSDGAAGRMTATAGLHNLPGDLRPAIAAETGHVFVRADLGQIEPRILAAVSGDEALAAATTDDDMYAPVAERLGVEREIAKVAVLGAMYGQTTGHGAAALQGLRSAYPVAMEFLDGAARAAEGGRDLRTRGGRLVRMGDGAASTEDDQADERARRSRAAARGRYGRNAMIQGAAAEFFKFWAATVRARGAGLDARIVLCLHDELLVHTPAARAEATVAMVDDALQEAGHRWLGLEPSPPVRFVADTSIVARWSDAK